MPSRNDFNTNKLLRGGATNSGTGNFGNYKKDKDKQKPKDKPAPRPKNNKGKEDKGSKDKGGNRPNSSGNSSSGGNRNSSSNAVAEAKAREKKRLEEKKRQQEKKARYFNRDIGQSPFVDEQDLKPIRFENRVSPQFHAEGWVVGLGLPPQVVWAKYNLGDDDDKFGHLLLKPAEQTSDGEDTSEIWTVRYGDTLTAIAQYYLGYDASPEEIHNFIAQVVELNDLDNPNIIQVEQELILPAVPHQVRPNQEGETDPWQLILQAMVGRAAYEQGIDLFNQMNRDTIDLRQEISEDDLALIALITWHETSEGQFGEWGNRIYPWVVFNRIGLLGYDDAYEVIGLPQDPQWGGVLAFIDAQSETFTLPDFVDPEDEAALAEYERNLEIGINEAYSNMRLDPEFQTIYEIADQERIKFNTGEADPTNVAIGITHQTYTITPVTELGYTGWEPATPQDYWDAFRSHRQRTSELTTFTPGVNEGNRMFHEPLQLGASFIRIDDNYVPVIIYWQFFGGTDLLESGVQTTNPEYLD